MRYRGMIRAVPGTICTTRIRTRNAVAPLSRNRLMAAAAKKANTSVISVAAATTIKLLRASSQK